MKKIIALLLLSTSAFAAGGSGNLSNVVGVGGITSGGINSSNSVVVPEGAVSSANDPYYKTLVAYVDTATANSHWKLFDLTSGSNSQYRVASGKKFYVTQVIAVNGNTASGLVAKGQLGYATATFTDGTASTPTGAVYLAGSVGKVAYMAVDVGVFNTPTYFPALSYPFVQVNAVDTVTYQIIGKEQ